MLAVDGDICVVVVPLLIESTAMKTWKKPVVREICVGAEINCYASGEL